LGLRDNPTSAGDASWLLPSVNRQINAAAPGIRVRTLATLERVMDDVLARERLAAALATLFGCLAVGLGAVGLHGVVNYDVSRRTQEIGVRMALGARPADTWGLVLRQTFATTAIGVGIGIPLALAAARAIRAQLFGIDSSDPRTLIGAAVLLALVALAASAAPAVRATRVDPVIALRLE